MNLRALPSGGVTCCDGLCVAGFVMLEMDPLFGRLLKKKNKKNGQYADISALPKIWEQSNHSIV